MSEQAEKPEDRERPDLTDAPAVIEVKKLVTHYGTRKILKGIDLTVREGEIVNLDLMGKAQPGDKITIDSVLLIGNEGSVRIGKPTVPGAKVTATVIGEDLGPKLIAFRFKRRKNVRRKRGHRQHFTQVKIEKITG